MKLIIGKFPPAGAHYTHTCILFVYNYLLATETNPAVFGRGEKEAVTLMASFSKKKEKDECVSSLYFSSLLCSFSFFTPPPLLIPPPPSVFCCVHMLSRSVPSLDDLIVLSPYFFSFYLPLNHVNSVAIGGCKQCTTPRPWTTT